MTNKEWWLNQLEEKDGYELAVFICATHETCDDCPVPEGCNERGCAHVVEWLNKEHESKNGDEYSMLQKAISDKINILLRARGMTRYDLAKAIGVNDDTMDKWMDGKRQITVFALRRCAKYFNTTMDFLCEGIDR